MKNQAARLKELEELKGSTVSHSRRSGDVITARVSFETALEAQVAAARLGRKGWGATLDGKVVRCLVVVA